MKISKNNYRLFSVAIVALFCVIFASPAHAENGYKNFPVSIKYLGAAQNAPVFELSFTNEITQEFLITITDKYNTIYTETIKGKGLVRKYKFVNEEASIVSREDINVIHVEIKNLSTNNVITYKINPNTRIQNEIELVAVN